MKLKLVLIGAAIVFASSAFVAENPFDIFLNNNQEPEVFKEPLRLPPVPWPKDNPYSKKKAELGRLLYFDKRLSTDGTVSCATCHAVRLAFTDPLPISVGIHHRKGTRHAPTVINAAYAKVLFWDGRASSLEEQSKGPIGNTKEMSLIDNVHDAHVNCQERIKNIKEYRQLFKSVFGTEEITVDLIAKAIATFERTVLSGNSPYDRYVAGDKKAMTPEQLKGYHVFLDVGCMNCHHGSSFSNDEFHNLGVGMKAAHPDLGRYNITKEESDWGAFKTPVLREVSKSPYFMHDGSLKTLEEVIDFYDKGGIPNKNLHPLMVPLELTVEEKRALVQFLYALNGEGWQHFTEPKQFPK